MAQLKTLTVRELIAQLQQLPGNDSVRVWLPGSTIALSHAFKFKGAVRIEGNIDPGSALDTEAPPLTPADNEYLARFPADQRATADRAYKDGFEDGFNSCADEDNPPSDEARARAAGWYESEGVIYRDVADEETMPHKATSWADACAQMDATKESTDDQV